MKFVKSEELVQFLKENNLLSHKDALLKTLRNTIRVKSFQSTDSKIPIGASKIGGKPDLPADFKWPEWSGPSSSVSNEEIEKLPDNYKHLADFIKKEFSNKEIYPLSFIAQFDMAEVSSFDSEKLLPTSGMLYFFYGSNVDIDASNDVYDLGKNAFKVWYYEGPKKNLKRKNFPKKLDLYYQEEEPHSLKFETEVSLRNGVPDFINQEKLNENERNKLFSAFSGAFVNTKLLGYADEIQNPMEEKCAEMISTIYANQKKTINDPKKRGQKLSQNSNFCRLLFQLDTDGFGVNLGDGAKLYFWIMEKDLRDKNFNYCWFDLQFH